MIPGEGYFQNNLTPGRQLSADNTMPVFSLAPPNPCLSAKKAPLPFLLLVIKLL